MIDGIVIASFTILSAILGIIVYTAVKTKANEIAIKSIFKRLKILNKRVSRIENFLQNLANTPQYVPSRCPFNNPWMGCCFRTNNTVKEMVKEREMVERRNDTNAQRSEGNSTRS